ncbi:MAG: alpha/beta fold hydrolase, partial [Campylobacter sp.]
KFTDFGGKAFIFWGEEDKATPLKSGERVSHLIKNSEFHALKGDHFFFLLHARYIDGVVNAGLNLMDLDDESGIESVKILSPKKHENLSEEAWGADENGDLKNAAEQNLTESTQEALEQEVAISTKTVSQSSLFDERSQDSSLVDQNPQLDDVGNKNGQIFKENLFHEQEIVQNQSELKNSVSISDEQNQILPKDEQGAQKSLKKPVQQTFDLS